MSDYEDEYPWWWTEDATVPEYAKCPPVELVSIDEELPFDF